MEKIRIIDLSVPIEPQFYNRLCVGCCVVTQKGELLLQQRDWEVPNFPGCLATFGGGIEIGETPMEALIRELNEELGAKVNASDVHSLGAITESVTNHKDLIYEFFWHDKAGTITGCYEGEARFYTNMEDIFAHPKVMEDVIWLLQECKRRGYLDNIII